MASTYPTTLDSLSTAHVDNVSEVVHAASVNDLADAVNKIEAELGTLPKGNFATVKAKLLQLYYGNVTTTQRNAIASGQAPNGVLVFNTDTNQFEWNQGNDGARNWLALVPTIDLSPYAPLASPALTGNPTASTQTAGNSTTRLATTAFVQGEKVTVINNQTASYTAVLGDAFKLVEMNVASANNFTVPPNSSVAFAIGTSVSIGQLGAGQTTIVAGGGVTLRSYNSNLKLAGQYAVASIMKRATDEWWVAGNLVP